MRRGSERGSGGVLRGLLQELVQLQQGGGDEAEDVFGRMREVIPLVLENYCRPGRGGERELKSVCQLVDLVLGRFPAAFHHGQGPELSSLWEHLLPLLAEPHLGLATHARLVRTLRLAGELYAQGSPGYYHRALVVGFRELLADLATVTVFLPQAGSSREAGLTGNAGDAAEGGEASEVEIAVLSELFCKSKDTAGERRVFVCFSNRSEWEALCLAGLELLEGLVPAAMGDALRASSVLESLEFFVNSGVKRVLPPASRLIKALLQASCDCQIVPIDPLLHSVMFQAAHFASSISSEGVLSEVSEDLEAAGTVIRELCPYASFHCPFQLVKWASDTLLLVLSKERWGGSLALALQETIRAAVERCPSVSQVLVESIVSARALRLDSGYYADTRSTEVVSLLHLGLSNCFRHNLYVDLRTGRFSQSIKYHSGRAHPIPQMVGGQAASVEDQITHIFDMLPELIQTAAVVSDSLLRPAFDIGIAGVLGSPCRLHSSNLNMWELARRTLESAAGLKGRGITMYRNGHVAKLGAAKLLLALLLLPADPPWQTAEKGMYYRILKFPWNKSFGDSNVHDLTAGSRDASACKCCSLVCMSIFTLRFKDGGPFRKLLLESIEEEPKNEAFASVLAGMLPFLDSFAGELYDKIVGSLPPAEETSRRLRESFLIGFRECMSSMSSGGVLCLTLAMHKTAQLVLRRYGISIAVSDSAIENADLILGASTSPGSQSQHGMLERPDILARLRDIICSVPPSCESSLGFPDGVFECVKLALLAPPAKESPDPPCADAFVAFVDKMIQVRSETSVLGRLQSRDGSDFCDHSEITSRGLSALQIVAQFGLESPNSNRSDGQARGSFLSQLQRVAFDDSLTVPAQVFVLQSVTLFGAHATDQGSLIVAIIILVGSLDRGWAQRSIAARGLEVILDEHGFQSQDLSSQLPMMFEYLGRNLIKRPRLIDEAADVLFQSNRGVLLRQALLETLPRIVDARDTPLLNAFSEALGVTSGQLLLDHGHIALCPALDCSTQSELNNILKYVEKVTGDSWEEIFQAKARLIVELVIWNEAKLGVLNSATVQCVSVPATKVESARRQVEVVRVALKTIDLKQSGDTTIEADVPNFLYSRHMLGLLASINSKLRETAQMEKSAGAETRRRSRPLLVRTQVQSLRMVEILIKLAETHVGPFTPDVMALLNHGLQKPDPQVQRQALVCLHALVVSLAKFKKGQLSTMLHQIVVMVLPFAEMGQANGQEASVRSFEAEVQQILSELLVKNRKALGKELQHLPPLPELPFLKGINSSLAKAKTALDQSGELRNLIANLEHDSQAVRYVALDRLRIFLAREKAWVDKLFTPGTSPGGRNEKLKVSLLESLLKCCEVGVRTVLTGKMSLRCADCLGQLGAIDPALLPNVLQCPAARLAFNLDDDLPFNLVSTELFRMLTTASDPGALESTRYAIQQLLKIYMKSSVDDLAEDVRVYVRPLLTSRYRLEKNQNKESSVSPIFGSTTMSFREWLLLWTKDLVTQVPPKHPRKALFDSCQGLFKYDMRTMLTVLPYLVGTVLAHGTDSACDNVRMEILSVLGSGSSQVETRDNGEDIYTEPRRRATPAPSIGAGTTHSKLSAKHKRDPEERGSMAELSMQAIFDLLDKLGTYVSAVKKREVFESAKARCARKVEGTLNKIPKSLLAHAALKCGAHARALLHYELHLRIQNPHGQNPAALKTIDPLPDDLVTSLLEMYVPLEEPDGLAGLVKLRQTQSLPIDDKLLGEKAGNWTDVLCMYEKDLQGDMVESPHASISPSGQLSSEQRGYMRCLLNTGHLKALQTHADGLLAKEASRKIRGQIAVFGADAAWRLGQWSSLEYYVEQHALSGAHHTETGWPTRLGRLLLSAKACDSESFNDGIGKARTALMAPLAAASMESYGRAYPFLVRLHMLHELETAYTAFLNFRSSLVSETAGAVDTAAAIKIFSEDVGTLNWRDRISRTQPTLVVREPLVVFHRTICMLLKSLCEEKVSLSPRDMNRVSRLLRSSVGECWLDQAQMCRRAGHLEPASVAVLQAVDHRTPNALLEKAHLLWQNDKKLQAISELRLVQQNTRLLNSDKRGEAKALLRLARWAGLTGHARDDELVHLYRDVIKRDKEWDKGYFHFAEYLDEVMRDMKQRSKEAEMSGHKGRGPDRSHARHYIEYLPEVIKQYGSSAARGTKKLFQNMPRMLTLWYNFGVEEESYRRDVNCGAVATRVGRDVNAVVQEFAKSLPTSAWLAVLPQLISRVCHPNATVNRITTDIITTVLLRFPQQVLWSLAAVSNSNVVARKQTALKILASARSQASQEEVRQLFQEFETFVDQMKKLCNHSVPKSQKFFMLSKSGKYNLLKRTLPIRVIVPIQAALTPSFSASAAGLCDSPFDAEHTTAIHSVCDKVGVLSSLQRPKKVDLIGDNGRSYTFLFKPMDDLRKDARLMEFASVLNQLFAKAPQSRRRGLYLRTFAVLPLTEDCGMIEWVPNTHMLRGCCEETYAEVGLWNAESSSGKLRQIQEIYKELYGEVGKVGNRKGRDPTQWLDKILHMLPPKLHMWFIRAFPEPSQWFKARLNFSRTAAVWSMVGHILGLGDRHGENVLLDSTSGDVVHVDFACLFDKGLELGQPEVVPFRLTQNMVDACGIQGYEGVFRRTCEISLSVLRSNKGALMSVLDTFVHDPLVEWTDTPGRAGGRAPREQDNPFAVQALENIQSRLSGVVVGVDAAPSLPLSPEGQTDRLIAEATDKRNLGDMYIWWMPWF